MIRIIFENGKMIAGEIPLEKNEIVGNFLKIFPIYNLKIEDVELYVVALEDNTVLEEVNLDKKLLKKDNHVFKKIMYFLLKKIILNFCYKIYDVKSYVMAVLIIKCKGRKFIPVKEIGFENFNISRSQYYLVIRKLKEEGYIYQIDDKIYLRKLKINHHLKKLGDKEL